MKQVLLSCMLSLVTLQLAAQTYAVPGAQIQPSWVFPIWFEDGHGERDTIYFCYDSLAHDPYSIDDTIFGERFIKKDTANFFVGVSGFNGIDSTFQTYVSWQPFTGLIIHKGYYPLKMYWDDTLFYSDSLPYPNLSPLPSARITIICSDIFGNCPADVELSITADSDNLIFPLVDSVIFNGDTSWYVGNSLGAFTMKLKPFDSPVETVVKNTMQESLLVYPTITNGKVWIKNIGANSEIFFFNSVGQPFLPSIDRSNENSEWSINMEQLPNGIYLIAIRDNEYLQTAKIIKQ